MKKKSFFNLITFIVVLKNATRSSYCSENSLLTCLVKMWGATVYLYYALLRFLSEFCDSWEFWNGTKSFLIFFFRADWKNIQTISQQVKSFCKIIAVIIFKTCNCENYELQWSLVCKAWKIKIWKCTKSESHLYPLQICMSDISKWK